MNLNDFFKEAPKSTIEKYITGKVTGLSPEIQQTEDIFKDAILSKFGLGALDETVGDKNMF